jgi:Ran GTPase-activating protein (RanGAP) involved in mRNA processing and transport
MAAWEFTISTIDDYKTLNRDPNNKKVVFDPNIKELNLANVEEKDGFRQFCEGLSQNTTLLSLNISRIRMQLEHCVYLVEALKQNKSITRLNLCGNMLGVVGMKYIKELLEVNTTLNELNLQLNSLGDEGCELICQALKTNRTLTSLILVNNNLTSRSLTYIGTLLQNNTTITHLDLSRNKLTDPSGFERTFNKALQINVTLRSIDLNSSRVTLDDLKEGLMENRSLKYLNIAGNYSNPTDLDGIDEILANNQSLTSLNLKSIDIRPTGFEKLADGLRSNNSLTDLAADIYHFFDDCLVYIIDALEINWSLTNVDIKRSVVGRLSETIEEISEKLLEKRKTRIEDTRIAMINIIRSNEAFQRLPLEIWILIFSFVDYPGVTLNFGEEFKKTLRNIKIGRFIKEGMQKSTQALIDKLFDVLTAK